MKKALKSLGTIAFALTAGQISAETLPPGKMNVIFILADVLGWNDCTLNGTTDLYQTPNLERLAQRGMMFTRAYSASPLCSPTRASILTGQSSARSGHTSPSHHLPEVALRPSVSQKAPAGDKALQCETANRLDNQMPTLVKLIKAQGYSTAHFGKWHLGAEPYSPIEHGFDVDIPHWPGPGPAGSYVAPWKFPDFKENHPAEHIEDRMSQEAVSWLRNVNKNQPFYMNYWQFSVHGPWDAKAELVEYYRSRIDTTKAQRSPTYAAMVHSLDDAIGALLDEVDRLGIANNTAIIFISDNGGNIHIGLEEKTVSGEKYISAPTSNAPLRGGKASMYEGGIRVPCIVVWPGLTQPGTRSDAMIQTTDFYLTILNLLGIDLPGNYPVDGVDITNALQGKKWDRSPMFTFFPHSPKVPGWLPPSMSVHSGDWKLIRLFHQGENGAHDYLLYNLKDDIGEKNNLSGRYPGKVKKMDALIERHIRESGAVVPLPNPDFDPAKYRPDLIGVQPGGLKIVSRDK